jgi:chromosome segregation protein
VAAERLEDARRNESAAAAVRRRAEEAERIADRELEAVAREGVWLEAQVQRATAERDRAAAQLAEFEPEGPAQVREPGDSGDSGAHAAWTVRVAELRRERDRIAAEVAAAEVARRETETRHARAEAAAALDEERITRADEARASLADRAEQLAIDRAGLAAELSLAIEREGRERAALDELLANESEDRGRVTEAEGRAALARDRARRAEEALRLADHAELEARLAIEALREQVLVELVGLGDLALDHLRRVDPAARAPAAPAPTTAQSDADGDESEARAFEAALDAVARVWAEQSPPSDPPTPARLATLRRRFHELGAANPFAVEEYAELRARLENLETQEVDLRTAIASTRELIDELNALIGEQFTTTFRALEDAFDRRFNQLFGGGYARLSLTDPGNLAQTGVDIVARPPGKKAQALAMLSGGERALTAVALLFAMLEVRPVPFCVLDEVDAALDEANVGRFSTALRSLADTTQFIVITHNRGTIEIADALYGVTVGEDSVSRVISLRLDEAHAITERQSDRNGTAVDSAAAVG